MDVCVTLGRTLADLDTVRGGEAQLGALYSSSSDACDFPLKADETVATLFFGMYSFASATLGDGLVLSWS